MTSEQAKAALILGKKLTHRYFSKEEWMIMVGDHYVFEDGCMCTPSRFWEIRHGESFLTGWSEFKESDV